MKYLVKISLIITTILLTNSAFAIDKSSINLENQPKIINTDKNIQQAQFMEEEVVRFRDKLLLLQTNYLLGNDPLIQKSLKDIGEIIYILRKIQTTKVNKTTADHVIKVVIVDLKNINISTKNHLRNIKKVFQEKKEKYNLLALKLSKNLDRMVTGLTLHYSKKKQLEQKDKKILLLLQSLQRNSRQLQSFGKIEFKNIKETKSSLLRIVTAIKNNILEIKRSI